MKPSDEKSSGGDICIYRKEVIGMSVIAWLVIAAIFIVLEIISLGLTSIWFAGGAVVAAILSAVDVSFNIQIIGFAVTSIILLVATRPFVKKHLITKVEKTNVESFVGEKVIVLSTIDNIKQEGQVKFNGIEWTARSADGTVYEKDQIVEIKEVQGVKLIVGQVSA